MITMLEEMYENFLDDVEELLDPVRSNQAVFARVHQKLLEIRHFQEALKEIEDRRLKDIVEKVALERKGGSS